MFERVVVVIDFTNAKEVFNTYKGSEIKKTLIYNDKKYLVKFPDPIREKNKIVSYINNSYSEYIGSNIFKICGFKTQNTILGKYIYKNKEKIVCACEDFTDFFHNLYEFDTLALSADPDNKIANELNDIMKVINFLKDFMSVDDLKTRFWDMFVIDAFIGNTDRHNGNWGIINDLKNEKTYFSPIYDCGSCLNPLLSDDDISKMNETEIKNLAINSYSCIKENGKKINYMSYINSMSNSFLNDAIERIFKSIDMDVINSFIDNIECISNIRKNFYKSILKFRYDILKNVYERLK